MHEGTRHVSHVVTMLTTHVDKTQRDNIHNGVTSSEHASEYAYTYVQQMKPRRAIARTTQVNVARVVDTLISESASRHTRCILISIVLWTERDLFSQSNETRMSRSCYAMAREHHTHIHLHPSIQSHRHPHTHQYTHPHRHTYTYTYTRTHTQPTHTHTHIHIYQHLHLNTHTYIHTHTHSHTHIYTYTYTCIL